MKPCGSSLCEAAGADVAFISASDGTVQLSNFCGGTLPNIQYFVTLYNKLYDAVYVQFKQKHVK